MVQKLFYRFTSGDALTDYTSTSEGRPANNNIGKWQQLMYSFSFVTIASMIM